MFVLRTGFARAAVTIAVKSAFCRQMVHQPSSHACMLRTASMATNAPTEGNQYDYVNRTIDESEYTVLDDQSMRHFTGKGIRQFNNGYVYTGEWINGSQWGQGRIKYPESSVYIGGVMNGAKHGQGQQVYPDGATLIGEFYNGRIINGRGTLRLSSGVTWEGEFVNGFFEGRGKRTNADGTMLEGVWKKGVCIEGSAQSA